ncbi:MAG: methionyl-tRNA formyltransferase [Candidatus Omnitrophica bacterium]|nr:methionyl-tRNA formyltransferase [Candidatus Omnitrophota bacterium]
MKIIFFGSAHFAIPALEGLIENKHKILCVVTQPDKKKGRHLHLGVTDVKALALKAKLKVFQPENINTPASVKFLNSLNADLFVIVAYGQLLSQEVLDIPKAFPINIHASLLPRYRGAAPINWAVIRGDKVTGVTIMQVTRKMDSGSIIMQKELSIGEDDDAVSLESKLRDIGAQLLLKAIPIIKSKDHKLTVQDEKKVVYAPKLKKSDGLIDWHKPALEINNLIRGTLPWPGAFTHYKGKLLKIYKANVADSIDCNLSIHKAGEVIDVSKGRLYVNTGKGVLSIQELQIEGKRRMKVEEFIAGHKIGGRFSVL